ncbi:Ribonuclease E/G [Candidatus Cyrtobacter comes]|uniref:Ribonuclease G n=1 Tax=Candidatus Cyrtobacter comes TaxID=675776 RepID=A0ABU5L6G8_9RICK|nr:Rne/Rng family ribonuclease [Candidatus Cyrtobacter comes]MDZ5761715.1 Ribonuclease E/G [Candidatus Cyrtobacter comes]
MSKFILVDAVYPNEIRIALVEDGTVEFFDSQEHAKPNTRGNIYLAKVSSIEPSLQAVFLDYGEGKNAFLSFPDIHPKYFNIPKEEKETLISIIRGEPDQKDADYKSKSDIYKKYKLQDVIKKDQVMLVQISKEERGNKGASVTTYISIAGRYCILFPNSYGQHKISKKISNDKERQRLKSIVRKNIDEEHGIIIRTSGQDQLEKDIVRDIKYLIHMWDSIRELTLKSIAPSFIHDSGNVVQRSIKDFCDSGIESIVVSGYKEYKNVLQFIKVFIPDICDKVTLYKDPVPIFTKYEIEEQISQLYDSVVPLTSGGYIVIAQTEALVAIDINSGKSTRTKSIEETALKTNIEATEEIARQLRLRDLSGLIVIDFIDLTDAQNRKLVENSLKEAFSTDKALTQIGKISPEFGLLEMSRQMIRRSFFDHNLLKCNNCNGRGRVKPLYLSTMSVMRQIRSELAISEGDITISGGLNLIMHILNIRRDEIAELENLFTKSTISFYIDENAGQDSFFIERGDIKSLKYSQQDESLDNKVKRPISFSGEEMENFIESESTKSNKKSMIFVALKFISNSYRWILRKLR